MSLIQVSAVAFVTSLVVNLFHAIIVDSEKLSTSSGKAVILAIGLLVAGFAILLLVVAI